MQDELFRNYLTRVSDPLEGHDKVKRERRNSDTAIHSLPEKDKLNPYARETRMTKATLDRKTQGKSALLNGRNRLFNNVVFFFL